MEGLLVADLDQRQVQLFIGPLDLALNLAAIGELDHDLVGAADHMIIGEDVAVGTDDKAGPETLFTACALLGHLAIELAEKILEKVVKGRLRAGSRQVRSRFDDLGSANVDNGRLEPFSQFDKIGAGGSGCRQRRHGKRENETN